MASSIDEQTTSASLTAPPYRAGTDERRALDEALAEVRGASYDLPLTVDGRAIRTASQRTITSPHDHQTSLGVFHQAGPAEAAAAVDAASRVGADWHRATREDRAAPFRRAAELLESGPWRHRLVAATMLELSKTAAQADGDVAEAAEFIRANLDNVARLDAEQPLSTPGVDNRVDYRPLEGFVLAVSPFNFTSMNNLAFAPALMGNTVVWKPAETATLVANLSMQVLAEAGLPDGVINLVSGSGTIVGSAALQHPHLSAVHFTGSTPTFRNIWGDIGNNLPRYRDYPRLIGETGGKDYVVLHPSADVDAAAVACVRGAYEYQGQKCAAVSRVYVPHSLWPQLKERLMDQIAELRVGDPTKPGVHLGAVISQRQHAKHEEALSAARSDGVVVAGGHADADRGWFVEPTLLVVDDPTSRYLSEEFFGPIMAVYVYDDTDWPRILTTVDSTSPYALTGAVFAEDQAALAQADDILRYSAGNYYINDKPTGAVVGQQPFGGARASGTNDKAGTVWNLIRFASPRTVKHQHQPERTPGLFSLDA